jgi:hypothetical protein
MNMLAIVRHFNNQFSKSEFVIVISLPRNYLIGSRMFEFVSFEAK